MKSHLRAFLFLAAVPLAQAGRDGGSPIASLSVRSLNFGNQALHSTQVLSVALKNNADETSLNLGSIKIQGSPDFTKNNGCPASLPPQFSCNVLVTFVPSAGGLESATLIFTDNSGGVPGTMQTVALSGTGTLAPPSLVFSTTSLAFSPTAVDGPARTQTVTVTNKGQQPGVFTSVLLAGANATDFHLVAGSGTCQSLGTVAAGASCTFPVSFAPAGNSGVSRNASLVISDNNNGGTGVTQTVPLTGTAQFGVPFVGLVNPGSRSLPNAGSAFDLTLSGANLTPSSLVSLSGTRLATIKNGSTLRATVPAGLITSAGSRVITVSNPGTVVSNSVLFPVPSAASTAPQFAPAGGSNLIAPANGFNLTTADLNRDGKQDLIVCSPPLILIYLANGDGTYTPGQGIQPQAVAVFNPYQPSQPSVVGALPYATLVGDMNGDGIPDLATLNYPNVVVIYRGVGDGTFVPQTYDMTTGLPKGYQVGDNPTFGAIGDFNRDGKLDIAVSSGDGMIAILQGSGDGTFALTFAIGGGTGAGSLLAGDFNSDGILDLAAVSTGSNSVRILLGDGGGAFNQGPTLQTGAAPQSIAAGDFNGDGYADLAVTNSGSNFVTILMGSASGTFTVASPVASPAAPMWVSVDDLNGDGKVDLVVANGTDGSFSVLLGQGNGTFVPAYVPVKMGTDLVSAYLVETNNDGRFDLIVFDARSSKVTTLVSK